MKTLFSKRIEKYLSNKKVLLAQWDCESKTDNYSYPRWYLPFKDVVKRIVLFSPKKNYLNYGKKEMNEKLVELVKREKPDFVFSLVLYDELDPGTFVKIHEVSPKTKIINVFTDDSWRYEDYGRAYAPFFDYVVTILAKEAFENYKKEGIKDIFLSYGGINTEEYLPLNAKKIYDVGFIGGPGAKRVKGLRFLVKNGVDVHIWGQGWERYSDLMKNCHGSLDSNKWSETVNQIKINLNFSVAGNGKLQVKGRPWEIGACKGFVLSDYFVDYTRFFNEDKEIAFYRSKEDLLKKVKHYLKNEKGREAIAKNMYKKILRKYSLKRELNELFGKIMIDERLKPESILLKTKNNVTYLTVEDLNLPVQKIRQTLKEADFVCFRTEDKIHPLRDYIQSYCLEKSGKQISFCDYYVYTEKLGNYLLFKASIGFNNLPKKDFDNLVIPGSVMLKREYFLNNLKMVKKALDKGRFEFIDNKNTEFVSIPLVETKELNTADYELMKKAFQMKFLDRLYSLNYQKILLKSKYPFYLLKEALFGKSFIIKSLRENLLDASKISKLRKGF